MAPRRKSRSGAPTRAPLSRLAAATATTVTAAHAADGRSAAHDDRGALDRTPRQPRNLAVVDADAAVGACAAQRVGEERARPAVDRHAALPPAVVVEHVGVR